MLQLFVEFLVVQLVAPKVMVRSTDKEGVTLYPVDSEFGFYVVDFLGAVGKVRDGDYMEGFVGNFININGSGIKVANAPTLNPG